MKQTSIVCVAALVLVTSAAPAIAQTRTWTDRIFVSASAGFRVTETRFDDNVTFTLNAEQGDFDAKYKAIAAPVVDVSGGARLWRNLGAGVGVSAYSKTSPAGLTGRIPHPFFFDQRREVTGDSGELTRDELAVHVQAIWMIPVTNTIDVAIFGGPSYISVQQDLVDSLRYDEAYPYDTATLTGANATTRKESAVGFNLGGDVTYMFTKQVGVGGIVRFSHAQVQLSSQDGGSVKVDIGGVHAAAGIRLRF